MICQEITLFVTMQKKRKVRAEIQEYSLTISYKEMKFIGIIRMRNDTRIFKRTRKT